MLKAVALLHSPLEMTPSMIGVARATPAPIVKQIVALARTYLMPFTAHRADTDLVKRCHFDVAASVRLRASRAPCEEPGFAMLIMAAAGAGGFFIKFLLGAN
jgi:hypothetical protein